MLVGDNFKVSDLIILIGRRGGSKGDETHFDQIKLGEDRRRLERHLFRQSIDLGSVPKGKGPESKTKATLA